MKSDPDRIRIPLPLDLSAMRDEVLGLPLDSFIEYNVQPLTAPAHIVDPSVPPPPPVDDYADGSWTEWRDTPLMKSCPYLASIVSDFRSHTDVTLVRLLRLAPGGHVTEHTDPTLALHVEKSVIRLTIPIITNDGVVFYLNGEPVAMMPGECWYLRLSDPHQIVNEGTTERISFTIDMIPNEWVRSLIDGAEVS